MKISRIFKTIFLLDFVGGLIVAVKVLLDQKKLLIILLRKEKLAQGIEVNML